MTGGTIVKECSAKYLVIIDTPYNSSAPFPIHIPEQTTIIGQVIDNEILWSVHLIIIHTLIFVDKFTYKTLLYNIFYFYIELANLVCTMVFNHEGILKGK